LAHLPRAWREASHRHGGDACGALAGRVGRRRHPDPATLKSALAEAPSSAYVEATDGTKGEGAFDTTGYATTFVSDAALRSKVEQRLSDDGFVSGYSRLWAKTGAGAALIEAILAFKDKAGASSYFGSAKLADTASATYTGAVDTSAIPNSYGVKDKASGAELVAIAFYKGNDLFVVGLASTTYAPPSRLM
jgi:hypothetical protein